MEGVYKVWLCSWAHMMFSTLSIHGHTMAKIKSGMSTTFTAGLQGIQVHRTYGFKVSATVVVKITIHNI